VKQTEAQLLLAQHLKELGIATVPEYRFDPERQFRFDLASLELRMGFECSGGNWSGGHRRGTRQEDEYDKLNSAQMAGWRVMQWTNRQILRGTAKAFLAEWMGK
jgi:hypothetical protein